MMIIFIINYVFCQYFHLGDIAAKSSIKYTVKMNMLYLIDKIVATDYKQYY